MKNIRQTRAYRQNTDNSNPHKPSQAKKQRKQSGKRPCKSQRKGIQRPIETTTRTKSFMNLRSGWQLGASLNSDAASRVPTLGSGTRSVGNLETIREDISSDTDSESWSFHGSEMSSKGKDARPSQSQQSSDMHAQGGLRPPTNSNPFVEANIELDYNVALKYFTMNVNNAYIYKDPWGRFAVKLADTETPFEVNPWVNYQHDSYMGKHGDRYLITKEPYSVDNLGSTVYNNQANQGTDQAGTSKQGTMVREGKEQPDANNLFKDLMDGPNFLLD